MKTNFKLIIVLISVSVILGACQVGRFIYYNFADIKDYKIFAARNLQHSTNTFLFKTTSNGKYPKTINTKDNKEMSLDNYLAASKTVAFLIIKNDTIQYENYFKGYDQTSIVPSFSMSKSITSILIGCAIDDKLIKSVDEPIINYIPELKKNGLEKVTIKHLLQMTSGIKFSESYINPFGHAAAFYYGTNLRKSVSKLKLKREPGKQFEYISGNTEVLGLLLESVLKGKTVTEYLQEKLWSPLGMEYDASWSIDKNKNGIEKTFCCINARARDFAKIGRLYLNKGGWNGKQIVSKRWVLESTKVDTSHGSAWYYQYQWWLPSKTGDFMANGFLGQYIYVNPAKKLIIVRLGKNQGHVNWWEFFTSMAAKY